MKVRKIVVWLVTLAMMVTMLPAVGVFAADDVTMILDTSKKASITKAGFAAESKIVNETKYSAKWKYSDSKDKTIENFPTDISKNSEITFSIYIDSKSEEQCTLTLYFGSENKNTEGIDYWAYYFNVNPGKWETFTFKYSDMQKSREPLGFNHLDQISLRGQGWSNKLPDDAVVYIENMYAHGAPTSDVGEAQPDKPDSTEAPFTEDDPIGEEIFYNSAGFEKKGMKAGGNNKKNKFSIEVDSGDNHYLNCETLSEESDYHYDIDLSNPKRFMVFQFDLSTDGKFPAGNIQYKDMNSKGAGALASFKDNEFTITGAKAVKVKKGTWVKVAIMCDFLKNTLTGYIDGEKVCENVSFSKSPSISMVRFYFNAKNEVGTKMFIDNYKIYEGNELRDIPDEEIRSANPKVVLDNNAAIAVLKDTVALSVGGNGIYYNREKHPIDAPAYVKDNRTLIPVRAVSEAFGLDVDWDGATQTAIIDGKAKIKLGDTNMILPDGSTYTLDVPAEVENNRTFLPLRALCEQILKKDVTWNDRGVIIISDKETTLSDSNAETVNNYLLYDRPTAAQIKTLFNEQNNNTHPRVMMNKKIYDQIVYNYANDPDVKSWGGKIISTADSYLKKNMPTYDIPDGYRLLATSRDVYGRAKYLAMAYILTKDAKYAEGLYDVYEAAGNFPDWNPQHFLDIGEMTCAFAIGYDWLYDYWTDEQKAFMEDKILNYGLVPANDAYYGDLGSYGWWTPNNHTNWNVVCNGGTLMGAVAIFDKEPDLCSSMIQIQCRDVEAMMNSFYPDGAWFEGIGYWSYTLSYSVNMFSTLEACFNTDFNLTKAPGFKNTVFFDMAGDGSTSINNFHDCATGHENSDTYFWLSNKFNIPGVTNVRLYHMQARGYSPSPFDLLWYNTAIKGTDFYMDKDTYLRDVEFVAMRNSWVDDSGAWLSYHGGQAVVNHSHLDTGTFVFDLAGVRWAQDLGGDNYNLPGYFGNKKHTYYRLRPEGHNVYVIDPDNKEGQTLNHFAKVENLVSKPRGAYSVLDMTPAYSTWVDKARRGYMLTDDRRSAVIRDEIDFNKEGREFIWFMHTPLNAEIKIEDEHTAYIVSKDITLKFMIDSDIKDYEFGVMDAKPLPTSPNDEGQNQNAGIQKLYLKGKASKSNFVECKMILASDPCADLAMPNETIDNWSIPDGEMKQIPVLDMISVDGVDLVGFSPNTLTYTRSVRYDDTSVANVTARAAEGLKVDVTPGATNTDPITIKVSYEDDPNTYRIYTFLTTVLPKLEDVGEYTRMQIVGHTASDEPEANHPATNVSNNDTSAESRWAASDKAWIVLDMGREEAIDAVGISTWKGSERAYTFKIEVSTDGENWTEVIPQRTTDTANGENIGIYPFGKVVNARYVRYSGEGNSVNSWNSITELAVLKKK